MLTGRVWTWEHPGRALLNWDLKPGEKFQRKPLGGVRGRSRVKEATPRRPERLVPMLPPLWLGSAVKREARSSVFKSGDLSMDQVMKDCVCLLRHSDFIWNVMKHLEQCR